MATLFLRWLPREQLLHLWCLGQHACAVTDWAASHVAADLGGPPEAGRWSGLFGETIPVSVHDWRLEFVTPWVTEKAEHARAGVSPAVRGGAVPPPRFFEDHLRLSLAERARKFTALCLQQPPEQRMSSDTHRWAPLLAAGAWHLSHAVLARGVRLEVARFTNETHERASSGNLGLYIEIGWLGSARLRVTEEALPWLRLLAISGVGKNPDKGNGSAALYALAD